MSPSHCIWPISTCNKTQTAVKWLLSEIKPSEGDALTELKPETQHSLCRATFKLKLSERNERRAISAVIFRTQCRTSVASEQSLQKPMICLITSIATAKTLRCRVVLHRKWGHPLQKKKKTLENVVSLINLWKKVSNLTVICFAVM